MDLHWVGPTEGPTQGEKAPTSLHMELISVPGLALQL